MRTNYPSLLKVTSFSLLIMILAVRFASAEPLRPTPAPEERIYNISIGNSPALGPSDAPVVIVDFSDFQ